MKAPSTKGGIVRRGIPIHQGINRITGAKRYTDGTKMNQNPMKQEPIRRNIILHILLVAIVRK
ncbi:MAG: hypothetical protein AM326_05955 [Candidatus Thorarchaeota archaeon SMTZ-45]|nr:MAG: hypothetical protein AM326_05955 [Candidatus Thorarchaeota archaeon SMTZ-45]